MDHALVFDIYRGTTHDGPGIRSTVFFQSCPLACQWCHNPEGITSSPGVWWEERSCIGCMLCQDACPVKANPAGEGGITIHRDRCLGCGACVKACPTGAMSFIARSFDLPGLLNEVLRDRAFYEKTGGGVTASGGECMQQHAFVARFFQKLQEARVNTALDTSGFAPWSAFEEVLPHTDYVLYDLKLMDSWAHRQFTGQDNGLILENVRKIAAAVRDGSCRAKLWIRTPLIPGATAAPENISAIGAFLAGEMADVVSRWELCAFNNSCITKYSRLGKAWDCQELKLLTDSKAQALRRAAISSGVPQELVAER